MGGVERREGERGGDIHKGERALHVRFESVEDQLTDKQHVLDMVKTERAVRYDQLLMNKTEENNKMKSVRTIQ